jgi:hypothetical protein
MEEGQWKGSTHGRRTCPTLPVEGGREGREGGKGSWKGGGEGGGVGWEGGEGRLESGLTCVGYAVTVGPCDLVLLKVLMRPDGVVDVRGTQDVVS